MVLTNQFHFYCLLCERLEVLLYTLNLHSRTSSRHEGYALT